jgi:hypothetical protein
MNLVKWLRKNNKKVMAIVVIVILFAFIGGPALTRMFSGPRIRTLATFADGVEITNVDHNQALRELDLLLQLRADMLLRSQDLRGILLSKLLFTERSTPPGLMNYVSRLIQTNNYHVSDEQLAQLLNTHIDSAICWILLTYEAQKAGIAIPPEEVASKLADMIPQLFQGQTYGSFLQNIISHSGFSEPDIIAIFGKLIAVLQYGQLICMAHNMTLSQVQHLARWQQETLDMECVPFQTSDFMQEAKAQGEPTDAQLTEQFDTYKHYYPNLITEDNPFGWGYKLPARVQLDYMLLKLDDVKPFIEKPTEEQIEEYYHHHIQDQYTQEVPVDPNDPNSPMGSQTQTYAEVAVDAEKRLIVERIVTRVERILLEAKMLTEISSESPEESPSHQNIPDYKAVAKQLSQKHKIPVYADRTGHLDIGRLLQDPILSRLYVSIQGQESIPLAHVVFSVDPLPTSDLHLLNIQKPRRFENIGPAKDYRIRAGDSVSGQSMVIVRIVDVREASVPPSLDEQFDITGITFEGPGHVITREMFKVKTLVTSDIYNARAFVIARQRAQELGDLVTQDGWTSSLKTFNEQYGQKENPTDPNRFSLEHIRSLRRTPETRLQLMATQGETDPIALRYYYKRAKARSDLVDQLYTIADPEGTMYPTPTLVEVKAEQTIYCVKSATLNAISIQEYDQQKAMDLFQEDHIQAQSLSVVHLKHPKKPKKITPQKKKRHRSLNRIIS